MKTILTFAAGLLLTLSTMAADHNPSVTIRSKRNFEIVVDGRYYRNDNSIRFDMYRGVHQIKVYERGRGFFGRPRLISVKNFYVRNNDLRIMIDYDGYVSIHERGNYGRDRGWDNNDRGYGNDRGYDDDRDWDHNDRGYDRNRGF